MSWAAETKGRGALYAASTPSPMAGGHAAAWVVQGRAALSPFLRKGDASTDTDREGNTLTGM